MDTRLSSEDVVFFAGVLLVGCLVPSSIVNKHLTGPSAPLLESLGHALLALVAFVLAVTVSLSNLYLTFLRPRQYRKLHGGMEGYKNISGIPLIGSLLVGLAGWAFPGNPWLGGVLLAVYLLDPGGIPVTALFLAHRGFRRER